VNYVRHLSKFGSNVVARCRRYDLLVTVGDHQPPMSRLARAVKPHLSGAAERLMADRHERRSGPAARREARVEAGSAVAFLLLAIALPRLLGAPVPPAGLSLALIAAIAIASRVEFDVGAGFVTPLQLVFVPILFLADPAWAPLLVVAGLVLSRLVEAARGGSVPRHALVAIGNGWFAVGPAVVLSLAGVAAPGWEHWPVYALALGSQFLGDAAAGMVREWLVLGVPPRLQLRMMGLVFLVDILLTPIGLLAALVAQDAPLAFLLVLPLVALLAIFARERGTRIDQAIELSKAYRGTALLLGEVISDDDEYTGEHSYGVIALALQIADEMGLDEDERRLVEFGALLHDVGKIGVPKEIINKAGPLDDEEWAIMRQHTIYGQAMLDKVGGSMTDVGVVVRASHERWDGGGYPDGTAGERIPLAARVVAVADTFSAITTTRSYRRAQSPEEAMAELRRCAGTQFDPKVVDAAIAVLAQPTPATTDEFLKLASYGRAGGARETGATAPLLPGPVEQPR
jgi:putative nucleotidyltransferase with HDIG domain